MREFFFRGKRTDNGEWVCGDLSQHKTGKVFIKCGSAISSYEVIPETVGQYTGLTDKNGKKIFEGDIMRNAGNVVEFGVDSFCINGDCPLSLWTKTAIIGNIHDNPELLKGGEE